MAQGAGSAGLKLLIDEMYTPVVAEQLRERGGDIEAVTERAELRAFSDEDLFSFAQQEERAIVTENIDDFSVIATNYDQRSQAHFRLVLVPRRSYPRGQARTVGRMVSALDRLLTEHPANEPTSLRHWL
jgi:predicted nuclease of predicted toxin-antitoxin system